MWIALAVLSALLAQAQEGDADIRGLVSAGRYEPALASIEAKLADPGRLARDERQALEVLRARCLFELGDYPGCERQLRSLLADLQEGSSQHVECLVHLAQVLSAHGVYELPFGPPNTSVTSADFGMITGYNAEICDACTLIPPRQIQLGARISW